MKPFSRYFALFGIGAAWLTAASIPAMAQAITTATATLICGPPAGFTATFSGTGLTNDSFVVRYSTVFTPSTGSPIQISQVAPLPVRPGGNFMGSTTFMLPATGPGSLTSGVTYTLAGSATLFLNALLNAPFNTIPIAFTNANNQITCGQQPFPFRAKLAIDLERQPDEDRFKLKSSFTLSKTAPAINPVTQEVKLQVGTFTTTIRPNSFKKHRDEDGHEFFTFEGVIHGVNLEALIKPTGTLRYAFEAKARDANLAGTTNPVTVMLTIGNNAGTTSVTADIDH